YLSTLLPPPSSTLFPYTTLFRSLGLVYPCLILNYAGQGALMLVHPAAAANPFFLMAPEWARLPLVFVATAATIIASQAVISGALDRKSTRLNSSHDQISYAVFCL